MSLIVKDDFSIIFMLMLCLILTYGAFGGQVSSVLVLIWSYKDVRQDLFAKWRELSREREQNGSV